MYTFKQALGQHPLAQVHRNIKVACQALLLQERNCLLSSERVLESLQVDNPVRNAQYSKPSHSVPVLSSVQACMSRGERQGSCSRTFPSKAAPVASL